MEKSHKILIGLIVAAALILGAFVIASPASAQTVASGSSSVSGSEIQSEINSGIYSYHEATKIPTDTNVRVNTSAIAPGIITANPCGLGMSAGASSLAGSISFGGTSMDESCVLLQQANALNITAGADAAIYHLAAGNEKMCQTLRAVGRIPAGSNCGDTPTAMQTTQGTKSQPVALFSKCERRADGKIAIKYTNTGKNYTKQAQQQCAATLQ